LFFYSILIGLVVFPIAWDYTTSSARLFALILFGLGGISWLLYLALARTSVAPIPKALLPLGLLILIQALQFWRSPEPFNEIYWLLTGLIVLLVIIEVVNSIQDRERASTWEDALLLAGVCLSLLDFFYLVSWHARWWAISGNLLSLPPMSVRSPGFLLGHPNAIASFLNLLIPLAVLRLVRADRRLARVFWGGLLLYFLGIVFFTSSRSAWLGLAAALLVMAGLGLAPRLRLLFSENNYADMWQRAGSWKWVLILILPVTALIAFYALRQVNLAFHGTFAQRLDIWQYALTLAREQPLLGNGAGAVAFLFALRSQAIAVDEVFHSHNLWLQIASGSGLVGVGCLLWLLLIFGRILVRSYRKSSTGSPERQGVIVYIGIITSILVNNLLDFSFWRLPITLAIAVILGLVYQFASPGELWMARKRPLLFASTALVIFVLIAGGIGLRGARDYQAGRAAAIAADWELASRKVCQAAAANPQNSFYQFQCSLTLTWLARDTGSSQYLEQAYKVQELALQKDPFWYLHWANLAVLEWQMGDAQSAVGHMQKAAEMAPKQAFLWIQLAWMERQVGQDRLALEHDLQAVCLNPSILETAYYSGSQVQNIANTRGCQGDFSSYENSDTGLLYRESKAALESGNYTAASASLGKIKRISPNFSDAYALQAYIDQKTGKPERAWKELQTAFLTQGRSPETLLIASLVAREQGREKEATDYLIQAFEMVKNPLLSYHYYFEAYRSMGLPTDLSPFLATRLEMDPIMLDAFTGLARYYDQTGQAEKAQEVMAWLNQPLINQSMGDELP
jgi:O-antigen ligase/Tfp pilus assembly protein PilF